MKQLYKEDPITSINTIGVQATIVIDSINNLLSSLDEGEVEDRLISTHIGQFTSKDIVNAYRTDAEIVVDISQRQHPIDEVFDEIKDTLVDAIGISQAFSSVTESTTVSDIQSAISAVLTPEEITSSPYIGYLMSIPHDSNVLSSLYGLLSNMKSDVQVTETGISVAEYAGSNLLACMASCGVGKIIGGVVATVVKASIFAANAIIGVIVYVLEAIIQLIPNLVRAYKGRGPVFKYDDKWNNPTYSIPLFKSNAGHTSFLRHKISSSGSVSYESIPTAWLDKYIGQGAIITAPGVLIELQRDSAGYSATVYGKCIKHSRYSKDMSAKHIPLFGADFVQAILASYPTQGVDGSIVLDDYPKICKYINGNGSTPYKCPLQFISADNDQTSVLHFDDDESSFMEINSDDPYTVGMFGYEASLHGYAAFSQYVTNYFWTMCSKGMEGYKISSTDSSCSITNLYNFQGMILPDWGIKFPCDDNIITHSTGAYLDFSKALVNDDFAHSAPFIPLPSIRKNMPSNCIGWIDNDYSKNYEDVDVKQYFGVNGTYSAFRTYTRSGLINKDYYNDARKTIEPFPIESDLIDWAVGICYMNYQYMAGCPDLDSDTADWMKKYYQVQPVAIRNYSGKDKYAIRLVSDIERNSRLLGEIVTGFAAIIIAAGTFAYFKIKKTNTFRRQKLESTKWNLIEQVNDGKITNQEYNSKMWKLTRKDRLLAKFGGKGVNDTFTASVSGSILGNVASSVSSITDNTNKIDTVIDLISK